MRSRLLLLVDLGKDKSNEEKDGWVEEYFF